jgi:glycosyltransferase involved in cell wall biosynthesis
MKVVMIGQKGIPARLGGIERHVEELSTRLVRLGVDVAVYCRPWYTSERNANVNGVRTITLPSLRSKHLDAITHTLFATVHAILVEKPDVIHYHGVGPSLLAWIPRVLSPRTRVVTTFHTIDRLTPKWGAFARIMLRLGEWCACAYADRTITVSETLKRYCDEVYSTDTVYLPNGVTDIGAADLITLADWNLTAGGYLLYVGRLIPHKGVHTLVNAYRNLPEPVRAQYPLVIVGDGVFTNEYLKELTAAARGANVKFVGAQFGATLAALYRGATVFVNPAESEGMPNTVLEAVSLGLPAIVTDILAHREILGADATYVAPKNTYALGAAIDATLNSLEAARARANARVEDVRTRYSWDRIATATKDVYLSTARPDTALEIKRI